MVVYNYTQHSVKFKSVFLFIWVTGNCRSQKMDKRHQRGLKERRDESNYHFHRQASTSVSYVLYDLWCEGGKQCELLGQKILQHTSYSKRSFSTRMVEKVDRAATDMRDRTHPAESPQLGVLDHKNSKWVEKKISKS